MAICSTWAKVFGTLVPVLLAGLVGCMGNAAAQLRHGDAGRSMSGGEGNIFATVEDTTDESVTIRFPDGKSRTITGGQGWSVVRHEATTLSDIALEQRVLVVGRSLGHSFIRARTILIDPVAENADDARRLPVTRKTGEVIDTDPLMIRDAQGEEIRIEAESGSRVMREYSIRYKDLLVGNRVLMRPGKLIFLPSGDGLRGSARERQPDATGERHAVAKAQGVFKGVVDIKELPQPPRSYENHFDAAVMDEYADVPFGIFDPNMQRFLHLSWNDGYGDITRDLGIHWAVHGATFTFSWRLITGEDNASKQSYTWKRHDDLIRYSQANNIHVIGLLSAVPPTSGDQRSKRDIPSLPKDIDAYKKFVRKTVERYDMDGSEDMSALRVPIRYWLVENEIMAPIYWQGSGADYADLMVAAYGEIKQANEDTVVICSMMRKTGWIDDSDPRALLVSFFERLAEKKAQLPCDLFDQHWLGLAPDTSAYGQFAQFTTWIRDIEETAQKFGYDMPGFVALEISGESRNDDHHSWDLVKRLVYSLGLGAEKVFWSGLQAAAKETTNTKQRDNYFRQVSLITGEGEKRQGYFAMRKLVANLRGVDWNKSRLIRDEDGVIVVRFQRDNKPIYVAWSENGEDRTERFSWFRSYGKASVTRFVFDNATHNFQEETLSISSDGKTLEVTLGVAPVIILPK